MTDSLSLVSPELDSHLILYLLDFLEDMKDFGHIFQTNKRLSQLSSRPILWQRLFTKYFSREIDLYLPAFQRRPAELFKNYYLLRLNQYLSDFHIKEKNPEAIALFKNMMLGRLDKINPRFDIFSLKSKRSYAYIMSENNFECVAERTRNTIDSVRREIYNQAFVFCCQHNHVQELAEIIKRYAPFLEYEKIRTGLCRAAERGCTDSLEVYLSKNAVDLPQEIFGQIFYLACECHRVETAKYLLDNFAVLIYEHAYGNAFVTSCLQNNQQLLSLFLVNPKRYLTINQVVQGLQTALEQGHLELAENLMNHFKHTLVPTDFKTKILVHLAQNNHVKGFAYFFKKFEDTLSFALGNDLLRMACQAGSLDVIACLLNDSLRKFPSYLAHKAKEMLEPNVSGQVQLIRYPTLILSRPQDEIQLLCDELEALKLNCKM
jgi:hypothetical protein